MATFDWQTDEEEISLYLGGGPQFRKKRASWLYPVFIIMIIIIAMSAASIYSMVIHHGEAAEEAIKADVLRTHDLVLGAADSKDVELFTIFISSANLSWQKTQIEAVRRGRFDGSPWLSFYPDIERPYRLEEIVLSSNLKTATVNYTRWYQPVERPEWSVPVQQTAIYRRSQDRWLLSPPNDFYNDSADVSTRH